MFRFIFIIFLSFVFFIDINASMTKEQLQSFVNAPLVIGKKDKNIPVWEVLDENKKLHSYLFETYYFAPIAGFAGGKMNLLVNMDPEGNFLDINVLEQNEPVFLSGLGIEPFNKFLKQYKGKSVKNSIKVGTSKSKHTAVRIDGITKATASVYIANDIILGSSAQVAKEKLLGSAPKVIHHPKKDLFEKYTWNQLLEKKLIKHVKVTKEEMENLFTGTKYEDSLSKAQKNEISLDLYIADVSIPSVSRNLLKQLTLDELDKFLKPTDEAILIFANGPYRFLSDKFVRRTSPEELEVKQDGFSLNIRDGDYNIDFLDNIPKFSQSIILEVDKRYDFDPSSSWYLNIKVERGADSIFLTPETRYLRFNVEPVKEYFNIPIVKIKEKQETKIVSKPKEKAKIVKKQEIKAKEEVKAKIIKKEEVEVKTEPIIVQKVEKETKTETKPEVKEKVITREEPEVEKNSNYRERAQVQVKQEARTPFWLMSIYDQKIKLISLTLFLIFLFALLFKYKVLLTKLRFKRTILLAITLFFIGWYGQGQLSMVTVVGVIKAIVNSQAITFLLYDPFSLIIWFFVLLSLVIWGRGTFCGWLCPYGVLQEFAYYLGRIYKLPTIKVSDKLNSKLVYIKYFILEAFILSILFEPSVAKYLMEIEPFKTSITLIFDREWPYVVYALFWIFLGMFLFRGFCRYVCPLGAFLAIMGKFRVWDWLPRRVECGNPCDNCHKHCNYQAIDKKDGHINYTDCFQCMDCVQIYSDSNLCKILKKDAKKEKDMDISKWSEKYE